MENRKIEITTAVGSCSFTIPAEFPSTIFIDLDDKKYKLFPDGTLEKDE